MNEEYVKHLMKETGEGPIKLWLQFVSMLVAMGLVLMALLVIVLLALGV